MSPPGGAGGGAGGAGREGVGGKIGDMVVFLLEKFPDEASVERAKRALPYNNGRPIHSKLEKCVFQMIDY